MRHGQPMASESHKVDFAPRPNARVLISNNLSHRSNIVEINIKIRLLYKLEEMYYKETQTTCKRLKGSQQKAKKKTTIIIILIICRKKPKKFLRRKCHFSRVISYHKRSNGTGFLKARTSPIESAEMDGIMRAWHMWIIAAGRCERVYIARGKSSDRNLDQSVTINRCIQLDIEGEPGSLALLCPRYRSVARFFLVVAVTYCSIFYIVSVFFSLAAMLRRSRHNAPVDMAERLFRSCCRSLACPISNISLSALLCLFLFLTKALCWIVVFSLAHFSAKAFWQPLPGTKEPCNQIWRRFQKMLETVGAHRSATYPCCMLASCWRWDN